jgi:hypothetical protein
MEIYILARISTTFSEVFCGTSKPFSKEKKTKEKQVNASLGLSLSLSFLPHFPFK